MFILESNAAQLTEPIGPLGLGGGQIHVIRYYPEAARVARIFINNEIKCCGHISSRYSVLAPASCVPQDIPLCNITLQFGGYNEPSQSRNVDSRQLFLTDNNNLAVLQVNCLTHNLSLEIIKS